MQKFARYPLLRLLVPFVFGIICYQFFSEQNSFNSVFTNFIFLLHLCLIVLILLIIQVFLNIKFFITFFIDISLIFFGYNLCYYQDISYRDDFVGKWINEKEKSYVIVKPVDVIVHKNNYNKLILQCYQLFDVHSKQWKDVSGKIIAYFSDEESIDKTFHPNAYYLLNTKLKAIENVQNDYAFDYSAHLKKQGVYYSAYINDIKEFKFLSIKKRWDILDAALYTRFWIINYFKHNTRLDKISKDITAAFLTGFDDELDNEIVQQFAQSGTLHILSVSGFHTGLIFILITFIFNLMDPYKKWRWMRMILTSMILFFYAFVTGFSPPIIRAAVMLTLIVIQQNFFTDRIIHPLNILSAAAFFVLVYNPLYLNDVGFLLSFSAMVGLVYYSPKYIFENRIIQSIWDIVSMSIGAQLGTLPFSLYFFHSFALLFIGANILIIPLSTIIMFMSILALIPLGFISVILNYLIKCLIFFNSLLGSSMFYLNWIHFTFWDALMLAIILIAGRILLSEVLEKNITKILAMSILLFFISLWLFIHHINYLMSYKKTEICLYKDKEKNYIWIQHQNTILFNQLDSVAMNNWARNLLLKNCVDKFYIHPFNYVHLNGKNILILNAFNELVLVYNFKQTDVLIWNNKKLPDKELIDDKIKRIYWTKGVSSQKHHLNHLSIVRNKGLIKLIY